MELPIIQVRKCVQTQSFGKLDFGKEYNIYKNYVYPSAIGSMSKRIEVLADASAKGFRES